MSVGEGVRERVFTPIVTFSLSDLGFFLDDKIPDEVRELFWSVSTSAMLSTNIKSARQVAVWLWNMIDTYLMFTNAFMGCSECNEAFRLEVRELIHAEQAKLYALLASKRSEGGWIMTMIQRFIAPHQRMRSFIDRLFGRR